MVRPITKIHTATSTIGAKLGAVLYPIIAAPIPIIGANIISLSPKLNVEVILLTLLVLLVIKVDAPNSSISFLLKDVILEYKAFLIL